MPRSRSQQRETGPAVTHEKLVKLARDPEMGHSAAAAELGVSVSQISSMAWSHALVDAGRYDTAPATSTSVRKLKDVEGNRWELISARTGETVARVKELYDAGTTSGSTRGTAASKTSSAKSGSKTKTGSKAKGGKAAAATPRRARTRAERQAARSNNPS